jgi:dTDP-4-dehydrorhamnose 3,5-epimerase-like enzyme
MSHELVTPSFDRKDDRGAFQEILNGGHWEALIRGTMKPGAVMGNHFHRKTVIFFYLTSGSARIATVHVDTGEKDRFVLTGGQGVILSTDESHAIRFVDDSEFIMLKSLKYDPQNPDTYPYPVED